MPSKSQIKREQLCRLMVYMLGYRPDEFGLVPDPDGYISYKELLQALHEESGWGYVRQGHFNDILMGNDRSLFQWDNKRIKVRKRSWQMDIETPLVGLPKILFVAVRRRAHPHALEKGLKSGEDRYLPLASGEELALRIGRRRDQNPVLLEVMALQAENKGIPFYAFGQLFLAKEVPASYIQGPPVSRNVLRRHEETTKKIEEKTIDLMPGSFVLEPDRGGPAFPHANKTGKKRKGWKEKARKFRKKRSF